MEIKRAAWIFSWKIRSTHESAKLFSPPPCASYLIFFFFISTCSNFLLFHFYSAFMARGASSTFLRLFSRGWRPLSSSRAYKWQLDSYPWFFEGKKKEKEEFLGVHYAVTFLHQDGEAVRGLFSLTSIKSFSASTHTHRGGKRSFRPGKFTSLMLRGGLFLYKLQ